MATYLTQAELTRLERMVGEGHKPADLRMLTEADLDDAAYQALVKDSAGLTPIDPDTGIATVGYVNTVNLYKAASIAWNMKAAIYAEQFDFEADGGKFSRSQGYHMCVKQAARYSDMAFGWAPVTVAQPSDQDAVDAFQQYLDDGGGLPS